MSYWSGFGTLWKKESIVKNLVFLLIGFGSLAICSTVPAQPNPPLLQVAEIIDIENTSKDVIFERSKVWLAKSFKSAINVIQYTNKETGSIIGKGNIKYPCSGFFDCEAFKASIVDFTIKIDTKDNKVRITFEDIIRHTPRSIVNGTVLSGGDFQITSDKQKKQVETKLNEVIGSYKIDILSQQTDENW